MARSFFERLTGGRRPEADAPSTRGRKVFPVPVPRSASENDAEEKGKVLHPVVSDESSVKNIAAEDVSIEEGQLTVDIYDDGPNFVIQSTVAGVKPEDIDISLQEDTLTIRGSRKRAEEINDDNFYYRELYWGTFSRSIILPEEVDFSKADAAMKNGLLTIRLPKKDKGEKKIKVKVG